MSVTPAQVQLLARMDEFQPVLRRAFEGMAQALNASGPAIARFVEILAAHEQATQTAGHRRRVHHVRVVTRNKQRRHW